MKMLMSRDGNLSIIFLLNFNLKRILKLIKIGQNVHPLQTFLNKKQAPYLWTQWALDRIQYLCISTPPHQCPIKPRDGCISSRDACQPNSPSRVEKPCIIFWCLTTIVEADEFAVFVEFLRNLLLVLKAKHQGEMREKLTFLQASQRDEIKVIVRVTQFMKK